MTTQRNKFDTREAFHDAFVEVLKKSVKLFPSSWRGTARRIRSEWVYGARTDEFILEAALWAKFQAGAVKTSPGGWLWSELRGELQRLRRQETSGFTGRKDGSSRRAQNEGRRYGIDSDDVGAPYESRLDDSVRRPSYGDKVTHSWSSTTAYPWSKTGWTYQTDWKVCTVKPLPALPARPKVPTAPSQYRHWGNWAYKGKHPKQCAPTPGENIPAMELRSLADARCWQRTHYNGMRPLHWPGVPQERCVHDMAAKARYGSEHWTREFVGVYTYVWAPVPVGYYPVKWELARGYSDPKASRAIRWVSAGSDAAWQDWHTAKITQQWTPTRWHIVESPHQRHCSGVPCGFRGEPGEPVHGAGWAARKAWLLATGHVWERERGWYLPWRAPVEDSMEQAARMASDNWREYDLAVRRAA